MYTSVESVSIYQLEILWIFFVKKMVAINTYSMPDTYFSNLVPCVLPRHQRPQGCHLPHHAKKTPDVHL
jgi:hypothetical protein